jgi:hypothetical protein
MELKNFQRAALDRLRTYLERARVIGDPEQAFIQTLQQLEPDRPPLPIGGLFRGFRVCPMFAFACPRALAKPFSRRTP